MDSLKLLLLELKALVLEVLAGLRPAESGVALGLDNLNCALDVLLDVIDEMHVA